MTGPVTSGEPAGISAPRLVRAGPAAFYLAFDAPPGAALSRVLAGVLARLEPWPAGVRDVLAGYASLLVEHDPALRQAPLERWALSACQGEAGARAPRRHVLAVRYGDGADRDELVERLGLEWPEIVRRHQAARYTVAFTGFTPGFPYLLGLPRALRLPRRATPRPRVPAGAVAIAGEQAGIYPSESPGGWWVLGRTDAPLYTPRAEPPTLLAPGDAVCFAATGAPLEPPATQETAPPPARPVLAVLRAWPGSATLQGPPRWGVGRWGLAQAGALDPLALAAANGLVGNPAEALALELLAQPLSLRAEAPLRLALAGGGVRLLLSGRPAASHRALDVAPGTVLELLPAGSSGRTAYLALAGGLAGEMYRGSGSTDLRGRVGGYAGRALAPGDLLGSAGLALERPRPLPGPVRYPARVVLRLYPGPQHEPEAFARLTGSSFRVAASDRMGVRLAGPRVALSRHEVRSEGSPWGALQLPPDGQPIILLADRGRTGGYAKPAVVSVRDLWRLAQARVGSEVWFGAAEDAGSEA